MPLLVVGVAAVIVFGTLYPFAFACPPGAPSADLFAPMTPLLDRKGDIVANLVLFVPLGLAVAGALHRRSAALRLAAAVALGVALSFAVEMAQTCVVHRSASWRDIALNAISVAAGAILALVAGRAIARGLRAGKVVDLSALLLLALYALWRLAPFVPTIDWQKWKNALKPLREWHAVTPLELASYAIVWVVFARLVRASVPSRPVLATFLLMGCYFAGRLVIQGRAIGPADLAGAAIGFVVAAAFVRPVKARDAVLAVLMLGAIVQAALEPYTPAVPPNPFLWIPFQGFLKGSLYVNVQSMAGKLFLYAGMVWLLVRAGMKPLWAGLLTAAPLAVLEAVQVHLDRRVAEVTDPILALLSAGVLAILDRRQRRAAPGGGPVVWPRYT